MTKIKKFSFITLLLAIVFICALFMGNSPVAVHAEEGAELPAEAETLPEGEETSGELNGLVDGFLARLKEKYGEDYETYYNAILEKWGSVEEYLLSLPEEQDEAANGWISFVNWLGKYAPIWGSILAVALIIVVILFGRKALVKVSDWVTGNGKNFKNMYSAFNTLYRSTKAQNDALLKLLGANEKFAEERKALEEATKELEKDEEV